MKKIDFLAIGDIVIDAFIKMENAHVHCKIDTNACELCVPFGDKIPYNSVHVVPAVGNSANAAFSSSRLGLKTGLVTNIGKDAHGEECLKALKKEKISTKFVTAEKGKDTNYHYVLWYDVDRTILVKHTDFTYKLPKIGKVNWLYLSSLAETTIEYHKEIAEYLKKNPETKLAFQPGTFQMKLGSEKLSDLYQRTEIFFCNKEEAQLITNSSDEEESSEVLELAKKLNALGPKIVVISDGPEGAYLYHDNELWHLPIYPDIAPPVDRTGAGDAFSSTMTSALALGKPLLEAFTWGPINSMSVVQKIGATEGLLSREKLEEYLKNAPENYKPKLIS